MTYRPELLFPCPFCGADEATISDEGRAYGVVVVCPACAATSDYCRDSHDAVKKWNRRDGLLPALRAVRDECRRIVDEWRDEPRRVLLDSLDDATLLELAGVRVETTGTGDRPVGAPADARSTVTESQVVGAVPGSPETTPVAPAPARQPAKVCRHSRRKHLCLIAAWLVLIAPGGWRAYDEFPKALAREFGMRRALTGDAAQRRLRRELDAVCARAVDLNATVFVLDGPAALQVVGVSGPAGWTLVPCSLPLELLDQQVEGETSYFLIRHCGAPGDSLSLALSGGGRVVLHPQKGGRR